VLLCPDLPPGSGNPWLALINARHTSMRSTKPRRPVPPATGRCRKRLVVMILAASRTLVVVRTAGRAVITASTQTSLTSFPSAMAWATSVSVMMPAGLPVRASTTIRAVVPMCFIRYAAAATWSCWLTVVSGGRMTSATVAVTARAEIHVFRAETLAMVCFISGLLTCGLAITLCSVGVSEVIRPPGESRLRACLPAAVLLASGGWCGGGSCQVAVD